MLFRMSKSARYLAAAAAALTSIFAIAGPAAARGQTLNEDAALNLLERTLRGDHVYQHRISLDCVSFQTEETTAAHFDFVLRENHSGGKCGGDPEANPVVDRYRVHRASGKIEWFDGIGGNWQRYDPTKVK